MRTQPWERQANPLFSPAPRPTFRIPKNGTAGNIDIYFRGILLAKASAFIDRRQTTETLHRGRSKLEHLAWIKSTGIPNAQAEVKAMQEVSKACKEEIELLDMQMLAIAAMHGTKAYEAACRRHLDAKILIDARHSL